MTRPARRRTSVLLAVVVGGVVLGGCGGADPADVFPDRPQDIDVAGLDPCAALTTAKQAELGVETGEPGQNDVDGARARNCGWNNFDSGSSYSVQLIGIDASQALGDTRTVETVAGYGAVRQTQYTDSAPMCALIIDIHDGQIMRVLAQTTRWVDGRPRPIDEVCRDASTVAADAVNEARRLAG